MLQHNALKAGRPLGRVEDERGEGLFHQAKVELSTIPICPSPRLGSTLPRESKLIVVNLRKMVT